MKKNKTSNRSSDLFQTRANTRSKKLSGFTLIEMIGVLAIIAILAVVIIPKVFDAIRSSKINGTLISMDSIRSASVDFAARYGTLPTTGSADRLDDLLKTAGYLDERFSSKLGAQADIYATAGGAWTKSSAGIWSSSGGSSQAALTRIVCATSTTTAPSSAAGSNFQLDGTNNMATGVRVVAAFLESVLESEARELSERIDGDELSTTSGADADGKVVYAAPSSGITDVYIYVIHQ